MIVERRRDYPMLGALAGAPADDEPADADEDAGVEEALAAYRGGEVVGAEELRRELELV